MATMAGGTQKSTWDGEAEPKPAPLWTPRVVGRVPGEPQVATPSVLIVDDSSKIRIDLRGALHAAGFQVTACDSRASAMKALRARTFNLVILDNLLHDGTGMELLRLLRGTVETLHVPVIFLASESEANDRVRGLNMGADEYVPKPYNLAHLVKCARRLTGLPELPAAPDSAWPSVEAGRLSMEPISLRVSVPPRSTPEGGRLSAVDARPGAETSRSGAETPRAGMEALRSGVDSSKPSTESLRGVIDAVRAAVDPGRGGSESAYARGAAEAGRAGVGNDAPHAGTDSARMRVVADEGRISGERLAPGMAWRKQDHVPMGSILYRAIMAADVASMIGPLTVARACRRAGVDLKSRVPSEVERALPALREMLNLFLPPEEVNLRLKRMAAVIRGASKAVVSSGATLESAAVRRVAGR